MGSATFLFIINFSIGLSFAAAFLALTWRSEVRIGKWAAAGFLAAAAVVTVEAFEFIIPSVRLASALSFSFLMLALTLITIGVLKHYRPGAPIGWLIAWFLIVSAFNPLVVFDLPRGQLGQVLGYQMPFAIILAVAAGIVLSAPRRRAADLALALVLALCSVQYVVKTILNSNAGTGAGNGVRDYVYSAYAHYSQTAGGVLSLLLGLSLLGVVISAVMEETTLRLQRDGLSGVLNRAAFLEQAQRALKSTPRGDPLCLIMGDLDHFKSINDRFGHAAGDEVIRAFGGTLDELAGRGGLCGRIGGEEFCVLLTGTTLASALSYIEAVRSTAWTSRYTLIPEDVAVTASFGITMLGRGETIQAAMRRADIALYEAKTAGRDRYRIATLETQAEPIIRMAAGL